MAVLIEYAVAPAAIAVFIGGYVQALGLLGGVSLWVIYLGAYLIFIGVHLYGVGEALKLMFAITAVAMLAAALPSRCSRSSVVSTSPRMSGTSPARMKTSPFTLRSSGSHILAA